MRMALRSMVGVAVLAIAAQAAADGTYRGVRLNDESSPVAGVRIQTPQAPLTPRELTTSEGAMFIAEDAGFSLRREYIRHYDSMPDTTLPEFWDAKHYLRRLEMLAGLPAPSVS